MKLGISSYTFSWAVGVPGHEPVHPLDEIGLLDKARVQGVKLLQICDNLPLHTFQTARLDRLIARAAKDGVQLEIGARGLTAVRVAEYAALARRVGARLIRFVIDDADYHPEPDAVTDILRETASLLDGLVLALENHDRFPAATLRAMIESAGNERIGVCLDTANSLGAGEGLDTVVTTLAPLTVNLHIKDFYIDRVPSLMGFNVSGRPAGGGFLNLPWLLKRLAPSGRCQTAILELWTPAGLQLEDTVAMEAAWAAQSLSYLEPFFENPP
jgi:sugar phosphate isomerase/epimerase